MPTENKSLYQLMTDPTFIRFNDWLHDQGVEDFTTLSETEFNMYITSYSNDIQRKLIDWYEAYQNAD